MQSALWTGSSDIESIGLDEVAPDERAAEDGPSLPAERRGLDGGEREELAAFGEQFLRLWNAIPSYSPVNARSRLTSGFGWRRGPVSGRREFHGGIDLAAARGTPVVAPADGFVEATFFDPASGQVVVLDHRNGIETLYGHLDAALVSPGAEVLRGAPIGKLGSTGWRSTGPHLHYAVRLGRKYVDPRRYLNEKTVFRAGGSPAKR